MKTRVRLQRRTEESSDRLVVSSQPRPFSDPHYNQPQPVGQDFSHVDLFSHAPVRKQIQTKLTIGAPNDRYEQEADRVADQVLNTPDSALQPPVQREEMLEEEDLQMKPLADTITPIVQREEMPEEEDLQMKPSLQREEMPEEEDLQMKPSLQREADGDLQAANPIEEQLTSSRGSGSPLPDDVRRFMEPRFGADFSQVRVHTGSDSVQMNQDLRAQAFTHQKDIYYGAGKAPGNDALTAHELTHVVQQNGAAVQKNDGQEG